MRWRIIRGGPARRFAFARVRGGEAEPPGGAVPPGSARENQPLPPQKKAPPRPSELDNPYYRCYKRRG